MALLEWDATTYDSLPLPHVRWGQGVIDRLAPATDATVIDLGCGTGRDTERLLDLLPEGRVVAVVSRVAAELEEPVIDYVRMQLSAVRA